MNWWVYVLIASFISFILIVMFLPPAEEIFPQHKYGIKK